MRNRAKCKNCKDVIESTHRHDFVVCSCYSNTEDCTGIFIDGGPEYFRGGGALENLIVIKDDGTEVPFESRVRKPQI